MPIYIVYRVYIYRHIYYIYIIYIIYVYKYTPPYRYLIIYIYICLGYVDRYIYMQISIYIYDTEVWWVIKYHFYSAILGSLFRGVENCFPNAYDKTRLMSLISKHGRLLPFHAVLPIIHQFIIAPSDCDDRLWRFIVILHVISTDVSVAFEFKRSLFQIILVKQCMDFH